MHFVKTSENSEKYIARARGYELIVLKVHQNEIQTAMLPLFISSSAALIVAVVI